MTLPLPVLDTGIATTDVCAVRVTASGTGVTTGYPANTGTYTSFYRSSSLVAGDLDYTAFRVTVTAPDTRIVPVRVRVSYVPRPADDSHGTRSVWVTTVPLTMLVL